LEIRDAIGIKPCEKLLFSIGAATGSTVNITLAKAPENVESCAFSRNGSYVKNKEKNMEV
jgi:uncharacterized OsmC-like protein